MGVLDKIVKYLWSPPTINDDNDEALVKATPRGMVIDDMEYEYTRERGIDYKTNRGTLEDYLQTYEISAWIYICVNRKASAVSQIPLKVWRRKSGTRRNEWDDLDIKEPDHPLVKLLAKPNPWMTQYELKYGIVGCLELGGNTYIELVGDKDKVPTELYLLLPYRTKIVPDPKAFILGYLYEIMNGVVKYTPEQISHIKYWHPRSQYYGLSPIQAAELSIITDLNAATYNKNFFNNSARPDGLLTTDQELSDAAYRRLRKMWQQAHGGVKQAHRIAIGELGLRWQQTGLTSKDMEFINSRKLSSKEIMGIYGITDFDESSYSNLVSRKRQFYEDVIGPLLILIQDKLNKDIASRFGDDLYIEFDLTFIQGMREDREAEARVDSAYVDRGIKTINQIRVEKGWDTVAWGDIWYPPNAGGLAVDKVAPKAPGGTAGDQFGGSQGEHPRSGPKGQDYSQPENRTKFPSKDKIGKKDNSEPEVSEISPFQKIKSRLKPIP